MYTLKILPCELPGSPYYSRLFAPTHTPIDPNDQRLKDLAWSMEDKDLPAPELPIPAGYTYFGQFIDHDLTCEDFRPPGEGAPPGPRRTLNLRQTFLNLECLYGQGPGGQGSGGVYSDDGVSFRLGDPVDGKIFDVPLGPSKTPLTADPRNVENVIIRQLHALLLKLHNIAVAALPRKNPPHRRFEVARQRVCHQYQYLVRGDFLSRVCHPDICNSIRQEPLFDWQGKFSIPAEFAQAAFRFGHSMVREKYDLQANFSPVSLDHLFGDKESTGALDANRAINWPSFFDPKFNEPGFSGPEFAMRINTGIVPPLFRVPRPTAKLFRVDPGGVLVLPHVSLQRGAASRLASGQAVRKLLRACPIPTEGLGYDAWADLVKHDFHRNTPLWYYILLEAELNEHEGLLGPVGSRIVGEVIEGALWANETSYLRQFGRCWKPDPWPIPGGERQMETLLDLVKIVAANDTVI